MEWDEGIIVLAVLVLLPAVVWSLIVRLKRWGIDRIERQRQAEETERVRRLVEEHKAAEARLIQVLEARLIQVLSSADSDRVIQR
jgi:hypothetical protein